MLPAARRQGGRWSAGKQGGMTLMRDLRIGVIGSGGRGTLAGHAHRPGKGARIVACCDLDPVILAQNREQYGRDILTTRDYRRVLAADLDAVFITTPDWLHEEHAVAALERGLTVYLEKPMAITISGCDRILRTARAHRARLFLGHNMRYMNIIRKMKALVDDGAVGQVKSIWCRHAISYGGDAYFRDWHADRRYSTGLLLQKAAHDFDVIHWLAGCYTRRVAAFGNLTVYDKLPRRKDPYIDKKDFATWWNNAFWPPKSQKGYNPVIDVEDQNVVIMQLQGDILGAYLQCHFTPDCLRNYVVIGDEGRLENYGDGPHDPLFVWKKRRDAFRLIGDEVYYGDPIDPTAGHGGADAVIVEEFLRFARQGGATTATPEAARMAVATGYQATMSLRSGGMPMDIPPIDWRGAGTAEPGRRARGGRARTKRRR